MESLLYVILPLVDDMTRKHWTHRMPRTAAKWALVAILVPFLLVGCVSLDKARQLFDTASQVCEIVDVVRCCVKINDHYQ